MKTKITALAIAAVLLMVLSEANAKSGSRSSVPSFGGGGSAPALPSPPSFSSPGISAPAQGSGSRIVDPGPAASSFGSSTRSFPTPSAPIESAMPATSFAAPSPSFGAPATTYSAPVQSFSTAVPSTCGYSYPTPSYSYPSRSYYAPSYRYNYQPRWFGSRRGCGGF